MSLRFLLGLFILMSIGCQLAPTIVNETSEVGFNTLQKGAEKALVVKSGTVLLDARSAFQFNLSHIYGSLNLSWEEFASVTTPVPGRLKSDRFAMTRRLARLGIDPSSTVIVIGNGRSGQGEEGRLAWTLFSLGITDVQFASITYFKNLRRSNDPSLPLKSKPIWRPVATPSIDATREEVVKAAVVKSKAKLIDVRTQPEYFKEQVNLNTMNVDWKEFITDKGRPNLLLKRRLSAVEINIDDRIIVISESGVRSAAATMALLSMGYKNAANYSGGLKELTQNGSKLD